MDITYYNSFSKIYDDNSTKKRFVAITTCSSVNENCPFIPEALQRFHIGYIDPKLSDNTEFTSKKPIAFLLLVIEDIFPCKNPC